jgi:dihydropteroate synthase
MVMGILNATPDSFSDGGSFVEPTAACVHGMKLLEEGADILDVGGESTRPGAESVPAEEELRRVIPVIRALRARTKAPISIDTSKAIVAEAAIEAGADIVNDVTGLCGDPGMVPLIAKSRVGVVIMHMRGNPLTMQFAPAYGDVVREVGEFFRQSLDAAISSDIDPMRIVLDPGIGFGKTPEHNRQLLRSLAFFVELGRPLLIGISRKSFLSGFAGSQRIEDRHWPGVALTSYCREHGARIVRVHDPKPHREALRMTEAILGNA